MATRPSNVPEKAVFVDSDQEWELGDKRGDKYVGDIVWWRPDGTLVCKSHFDDAGELHGTCRRFHPDGSISMESRYVHGVRWGKTWHTRSAGGGSPEDVHMEVPSSVHRLEMVYVAGKCGPVFANLGRAGADEPPDQRFGVLRQFDRDILKYGVGTVFTTTPGIRDIAGRAIDAAIPLFYRGIADDPPTMLRFGLTAAPPEGMEPWQDPNATVIAIAEVRTRILVAVDLVDGLTIDDRPPPQFGARVEQTDEGVFARKVQSGMTAEKIGMVPEDRLERFGTHEVRTLIDYLEGVREWSETGALEVRVRRGSEALTLGDG